MREPSHPAGRCDCQTARRSGGPRARPLDPAERATAPTGLLRLMVPAGSTGAPSKTPLRRATRPSCPEHHCLLPGPRPRPRPPPRGASAPHSAGASRHSALCWTVAREGRGPGQQHVPRCSAAASSGRPIRRDHPRGTPCPHGRGPPRRVRHPTRLGRLCGTVYAPTPRFGSGPSAPQRASHGSRRRPQAASSHPGR